MMLAFAPEVSGTGRPASGPVRWFRGSAPGAGRDVDLDPAIVRAALCRLVVADRAGRAVALRDDAIRRDPVQYQVIAHCVGAAERQLLIRGRLALRVRVSFDHEARLRVALE